MTEPKVLCYQCGKHITEGKVIVFQDPGIGTPTFCSVECSHKYDPAVLTLNSLTALAASISRPETDEERERLRRSWNPSLWP